MEQLPCERFLQAFLRAKLVGENRGKFQNYVKLLTKQFFFPSIINGYFLISKKFSVLFIFYSIS